MPQLVPLLAASEPMHGTLTSSTEECMQRALLNGKKKSGIGETQSCGSRRLSKPRQAG